MAKSTDWIPDDALVFDVETHSAEYLFEMPPEKFVRLIGYKRVCDEEVTLTTDLSELKEQLRRAPMVVGHNIHSFDLPAVFGTKSDEPLELAMARKVYDTWTHAALVHPAPYQYINRYGKKALASGPSQMKAWFGLDEQAHQLGVPGKTHDLKALAKEFGGFGDIPVDDERYREYLVGDVKASEAVAIRLLQISPLDTYAWREQEIEARKAVISANGLRVDIRAATRRRDELAVRKQQVLSELQETYGLPTGGKSPWASKAGKEAIMAALKDHGVTPRKVKDWPKTATGNLSLSGDALIQITEGTPAEGMGRALAELKGQRALSQLALDSAYSDGFVHPDITMLQRSGRWSTTKPGLTVWTNNGPGAVEKDYYVADSPDHVLIEFDYSNADARIVAAYSGDTEYAKRFEPGADGHMINAIAAWGEEEVAKDPKGYRTKAKPLGHGWSYGGRPRGLQRASGLPLEDATTFCDGMDAAFRRLVDWQDFVRSKARQQGYVMNAWGRKMPVEQGREFTQAPALMGQSGTREIVCDALLRMPIDILRMVKAQVHDALLFSVPRDREPELRARIKGYMETTFNPQPGGQELDFPVESGPSGRTWYEAIH